ncbi:hypothetical protein A8B75_10905 [Sphingomonadales bacterium EhC05]|nr:hypothetical protein A8B75_10905 [Sphingomonadales bacterium EhC05]
MRTPEQGDFLWNMMVQDVANGAGLAIIDTTGNYARPLLDAIPAWRSHHTYYMRPSDQDRVVGFNPFRGIAEPDRSRVSQDIMELFKSIWDLDYDRTPLLLDLLRSSARLLLDSRDGTLLGMYALLTSDEYRRRLVQQCTDPLARRFWTEFDSWPAKDRRDKPQPVLTRLRAFLSDPVLRNVLGQVQGALDVERLVQRRQILLADLDRRELGPETARLFACLLATRLRSVLESRNGGWPFYIYLPAADQIHVAIIGRLVRDRYEAGGVVAGVNQVGSLLPEERANLLSAETLVTFRVATDDLKHVTPRFPLPGAERALPTLGEKRLAVSNYHRELALNSPLDARFRQRDAIVQRSGRALCVPRQQIEQKIERFLERF